MLRYHLLAAVAHLLEGRRVEALEAFRAASARSKDPDDFVDAAIVADELGQEALRDELLQQAHDAGVKNEWDFVELIRCFQNCLAGELPVKRKTFLTRPKH